MCMSPLLFLIAACGIHTVEAHGYLAEPPSKNAADINSYLLKGNDFNAYWKKVNWWVDKASLNGDPNQKPWSAPGHFNHHTAYDIAQQAFHPCGCFNPLGPQYCAGVGLASGFGEISPGHTAAEVQHITPRQWQKGSEQETAFSMYANHVGGYLYMLCKKSTFDQCRTILPAQIETATQTQKFAYQQCVWDCFEASVLEFVPSSQKIQYGNRSDLTVSTNIITKGPTGTLPSGSVWREVPLVEQHQKSTTGEGRCNWDAIDSSTFSSAEAKAEFIAAFGDDSVCDSLPANHLPFNWHIKDSVRIPANIPSGEYLLSWRWECGVADQLWSNCADVMIVGEGNETATSPEPTPTPVSTTITTAEATVTTTDAQECLGANDNLRSGNFAHYTCQTYMDLDSQLTSGHVTYCQSYPEVYECCYCQNRFI